MFDTTVLSEVLGYAAVVLVVVALYIALDPTVRARRAANRLTRRRRHAAAGCVVCRLDLEGLRIEAEVAAQAAELVTLEALLSAEEARR